MEAACFGKPCITAGTGRYSGLGFTLDNNTREEYLRRLEHLQNQPTMNLEEVRRAKWHAYAAFILRPWPMLSAIATFNYSDRGSAPLDHNLRLVVTSFNELNERGDLHALSIWAEGDAVDFVHRTGKAK